MLEAILANIVNEALESDPTTTTILAAHLNAAMQNQASKDAYRAMWGVEWTALGNGVAVPHKFATPSQVAITVANGSK